MKPISEMDQAELAAFVQTELRKEGILVILSGGAAVGIYSRGDYVSMDIDFVNARFAARDRINRVLQSLGFQSVGRHYEHPDSDHIVEFPPGPLTLGNEPVETTNEISYETGILEVLTPTDCIKDRLAHYYHWGDNQCLHQALLVAKNYDFDLAEIESWSKGEGQLVKFNTIRDSLLNS